jgi:hypothetical protein
MQGFDKFFSPHQFMLHGHHKSGMAHYTPQCDIVKSVETPNLGVSWVQLDMNWMM